MKIGTRLAVMFAIASLVLYGCSGGARPVAQGQAPGRVAYVSGGNIWTAGLSGMEPTRLTTGGGYAQPAWSPSGRWILARQGKEYVSIRADGSGQSLLPAGIQLAKWAPDEDWIGFTDREGRLGLVRADGAAARFLVEPGQQQSIGNIAWSPDGDWIAYDTSYREPPTRAYAGLWRVPAAGGDPVEVLGLRTPYPFCLSLAGWTAPGDGLLFWPLPSCSASVQADGVPLFVQPLAGGDPIKLVPFMLPHRDFLSVAPDGRLAAVEGSSRNTWTNKRVIVVDVRATAAPAGERRSPAATAISPPDQAAVSPAWAPGSTRLAYVAGPDAEDATGGAAAADALMKRRLWVASGDGSSRRLLTNDPALRDESPAWTADGAYVLLCRINRQSQAGLWLVQAVSGEARRLADLDPPESFLGYYGWVNCGARFDYAPGR